MPFTDSAGPKCDLHCVFVGVATVWETVKRPLMSPYWLMKGRTLLAAIVASVAGSAVYLALVYWADVRSSAYASTAVVALALPAMLCATLFVTFVLMPIHHWLHGVTQYRLVDFMIAGCAAWLLVTAVLLSATTQETSQLMATSAQLLIPGLIVVVTFGFIAKGKLNRH